MHGGSPLRSAPGADRSGHGDAEPAGSSHRLSRVFNVYICSARLPPCACSLACYSSNGIFQPQSTSRPPTVPAHTPAPACTPRCFGFRNHTPESPALPMQSPAVSRSRHLTVCDGVSVCVPVRLCQTSGASDIATLPWRLLLRHRSHRLSRVQALQNVARDPLLPFAMQ